MRRMFLPTAALLSFCACSGPYSTPKVAAKSEKPTPVKVRTVRLETIPELVTANGELFAEDVATISAKVPGRVTRLLVDLGSHVEPGQVIAELEKDDYEFRLKQAEALVEQTRARLGIAAEGDFDEAGA